MKIQTYTRIAFTWTKQFILDQIRKNGGGSGAMDKSVPTSGEYVLKGRNLPVITKKSAHHTGVTNNKGYTPQGCTVTGSNKMMIAWAYSDGNTALLEERYISSGKLIRSKEMKLGHANCLSYNPTKNILYCCKYNTKETGETKFTNDVTIIDYETLTITGSINVKPFSTLDNPGVAGCCYDAIQKNLVLSTVNSAAEATRKREVIVLNEEGTQLINSFPCFPEGTYEQISNNSTTQGIQMAHNGYCYYMDSTYKAIHVLDYITQEAIAVLNIEDWDDMWKPVLELEAMAPRDPMNPKSDILIFHGGTATVDSWFTNTICGEINPFIGKSHRRRDPHLDKSTNGVVNPDYDCEANSCLQNGATIPYVDPNLALIMLSNRPGRIIWNEIAFKKGDYGLLRTDNVCCNIKCEAAVNISKLNVYNSTFHIDAATVKELNGYNSDIWMSSCACTKGNLYSSELKVFDGSGKYDGKSSSIGTKYSGSATLTNFKN